MKITQIMADLDSCIKALIEIRDVGLPAFEDDGYVARKRLAGVCVKARQVLLSITTPVECESCDGNGWVICSGEDCARGKTRDGKNCPDCDGRGHVVCEECSGKAMV